MTVTVTVTTCPAVTTGCWLLLASEGSVPRRWAERRRRQQQKKRRAAEA